MPHVRSVTWLYYLAKTPNGLFGIIIESVLEKLNF